MREDRRTMAVERTKVVFHRRIRCSCARCPASLEAASIVTIPKPSPMHMNDSVSALTHTLALLGLLPQWSSYQPLVMNLPDGMVDSNLTISHPLAGCRKNHLCRCARAGLPRILLHICRCLDGVFVRPNELES